MITQYSTGGYVDAWCTKCKLELGHTIVAMVQNVPKRVKCNTCNGEHNFRARRSERNRRVSKNTPRKTGSREAKVNEYMSRLTGSDLSRARKYSMRESFKKDELIDHPSFGIGIVLTIIQADKMEILFKDGPKLLTQNQY